MHMYMYVSTHIQLTPIRTHVPYMYAHCMCELLLANEYKERTQLGASLTQNTSSPALLYLKNLAHY